MLQLHFLALSGSPKVGCSLSKHPVSCQHSATGVVSGESGGGALTQGRWTAACLSPVPSCFIWAASSLVKRNPQPLGVIGYEYPVKSGWWKDVNILLMFRVLICSLTHRIMANGRLPKEWSSSSESRWLTEAEQVGRAIERTREGCGEWGKHCERQTWWREGYYMWTARERITGALRVRKEIRTSVEQRWAWLVCDQWQNGSNSEVTSTVELHGSFRRHSHWLRPVIIQSHIQKNATRNLT